MPIVVDWAPVQASGSLALQTGSAVGQQRGQLTHLRRQDEASAQAADINQRNRELSFNQAWAPINERRQAGLQFGNQSALMNQEYALRGQQEEVRQAGDLQEAKVRADALAQAPYARQQADYQYDQRREADAQQKTALALRDLGLDDEEIAQELDRYHVIGARRRAGGAAAVKGGGFAGGVTESKRPTGELRSLGFDAARNGSIVGFTPEVMADLRFQSGGMQMPMIQVATELEAGAYESYLSESTPLERVQAVASNPKMPDWARSAAQRAMVTRGDVRFGSNQRRTPSAASGMSDADLFRAAGVTQPGARQGPPQVSRPGRRRFGGLE